MEAGTLARPAGTPQVICSDGDTDYERADFRILGCRICLTHAIVMAATHWVGYPIEKADCTTPGQMCCIRNRQ